MRKINVVLSCWDGMIIDWTYDDEMNMELFKSKYPFGSKEGDEQFHSRQFITTTFEELLNKELKSISTDFRQE
jgi:hypothetical protein